MSGITELDTLLRAMRPQLFESDFVFCTVQGSLEAYWTLCPVATFSEPEGLTLVLHKATALRAGLAFEGVFRQITLTVHSSLEAVGLTAAISSKLASRGISANVIAAFYHDHVFVPSHQAHDAMAALQEFEDADEQAA